MIEIAYAALVGIVAAYNMAACVLSFVPKHRTGPAALILVTRIFCVPAAVGMVAEIVRGPSGGGGWFALYVFGVVISQPLMWWTTHRRFHKDGHGRKLREAATGWVRRTGNRLTVVPAGGERA